MATAHQIRYLIAQTKTGRVRPRLPREVRDEVIYRFNRRRRETELFGFVLNRAVRGEPLPYRRLTAELFR